MSNGSWPRTRIAPAKLIVISIALALVLPLLFLDWHSIQKQVPLWVFPKAELTLLIGLEIAYGATLLLIGPAIPVLAFRCTAGRRQGRTPPRAARLLLCAGSVLLALLAAEATVFVRARGNPRTPDIARDARRLKRFARARSGRLPLRADERRITARFPRRRQRRRHRPGCAGRIERRRSPVSALALARRNRQMAARRGDPRSERASQGPGTLRRYPPESTRGARPTESPPRNPDRLLRTQRVFLSILCLPRSAVLLPRPAPDLLGSLRPGCRTTLTLMWADSPLSRSVPDRAATPFDRARPDRCPCLHTGGILTNPARFSTAIGRNRLLRKQARGAANPDFAARKRR